MRTSSRSRRRSSPFSSIQSNAYRKTLASWHRWRIRSKLGTPRSRRKPHPPAGRRSARGQRMPGATHVPLTVAQKSRRRVFYVGGPFGHYCPLKYAGAAQAQSPGEKGGRARLSGGRAPAGMPRAGAPLAFPLLFSRRDYNQRHRRQARCASRRTHNCARKGRYHVDKLIEKYGRKGNLEMEGAVQRRTRNAGGDSRRIRRVRNRGHHRGRPDQVFAD